MEPAYAPGRQRASAAAGDSPPDDPGVLDAASSLWRELRGLAHEGLTLAALEARQAGRSLVTMIAAGVMVALLVVSAWLGVVGAGVLGLMAMGVPAALALLIAVAANLVAAAMLGVVVRRQSRHLLFPATMRSLRPLPVARQAAEP